MSFDFMMRKEDMDKYLNELAKELRKFEGRNAHFEIVIAGGASIVQNYTFRQMSSDIDAMINDRAIRDAARRVADKFDLPMDWINSDFEHTIIYSGITRILKVLPNLLPCARSQNNRTGISDSDEIDVRTFI